MVDWAVRDEAVVVRDRADEVTVGVPGWRPRRPTVPLERSVDAAVAGAVDGLGLPARLRRDGEPVRPPATVDGDGEDLVVEAQPTVDVAFQGSAPVAGDREAPEIRFADPRVVALGFRGDTGPGSTITVPGTPAGLATYLTHANAGPEPRGPDRSHPAMRRHPPRLAIGAEQSIPDRLADRPTRTQLEVRVPADLDHLFVAAPLAYYLGTSVSVGADDPALVGAEPLRTFDRLPAFQDQVARLLPGIFALDAALRSTDGAADPPLPTELRAAAPVDRLARYLDLLADRDPSPTWHLSTYVDPTVERAACLPYLLDRLSLVYLAESTPLDGQDLLQRALDDFFRAPADAPSVDPLDPELRRGAAHAWLAEGTPIDAFTTSAVAHRNRLAAAGTGGPMTVDLVVNDAEMDAERSVAAVYREGLAGHPIEVTVHEGVPTADLARLFEAAGDLLHYVGHCEVDGLVCPDGPLDAGSLDDVDTRAVFLNACGSVHEGRRLVRAGAAAGAVTLTAVLDDQAATVGTAFARLLGAGLTVERALRVARTGVMMGKDYAVVGDGTLTVAPAYGHPGVLVVEPTAGAFEAEYRVVSPQGAGRRYPDPFGEGRRLYGRVATASLARDELVTFCRRRSVPVVYDGEVTSTEAVLATLT